MTLERSVESLTRIAKAMEDLADRVTIIEYPEEKRSVDMVIEYGGVHTNCKVIVKVSDIVSNRKRDFVELKKITELLNINALVIAKFYNREKLLDNVLYVRGRIGLVDPETIESIRRREGVYIYEYQGSYYVKVKGEVLRELRSRRRLGYSMLAKMVGITAKALYEYEQGRMGMSAEVAERFLEIFGKDFENALEQIDIFTFRIVSNLKRGDVTDEVGGGDDHVFSKKGALIAKLRKRGVLSIESFKHIPSDMVVKSDSLKAFIALAGEETDLNEAEKKCRENAKLAHELDGKAITILSARNRDLEYVAEKYSDIVSRKLDDIIDVVHRESRQ